MRRFREAAKMSLEGLGSVVRYSKSSLARFETAETMIPPDLPAKLDAAFGTDGIFRKLYMLASKEIHPDQFRRLMELEALARLIEEYASQLVPGLMQTEGYASALFKLHYPSATPEEIAERVTARMSRQALLHADPPPHFSAILDEAVLRRSFGGPVVMREQLGRLLAATHTPTTTLQVLPFSHGGHALAGGSLKLMTLGDDTQVLWEESSVSGTLFEEKEVVQARHRIYDLMRAYALSPKESAVMIRSAMEELAA
jgi:transcriptional regulator with XRE-family HTH domain